MQQSRGVAGNPVRSTISEPGVDWARMVDLVLDATHVCVPCLAHVDFAEVPLGGTGQLGPCLGPRCPDDAARELVTERQASQIASYFLGLGESERLAFIIGLAVGREQIPNNMILRLIQGHPDDVALELVIAASCFRVVLQGRLGMSDYPGRECVLRPSLECRSSRQRCDSRQP